MFGVVGVRAIEINVAGVVVNTTGLEVTEPTTAVILVLPALRDVARPLEPAALLIDATELDEDTQDANVVRF
jgi:hypothetical protein